MDAESGVELQALYELVFGNGDPRENRLMVLCASRRPYEEIKLFRQKVRQRFKASESLDGILAQNFKRSIGILGPEGGDELLKRFVGSASFRGIRDVPGFPTELPVSECFREYLAGVGAASRADFQAQLNMDFHQCLLVEAMLSPGAPWIERYERIRFGPEGACRIDFTSDGIRYVFAIEGGKILKYKGAG